MMTPIERLQVIELLKGYGHTEECAIAQVYNYALCQCHIGPTFSDMCVAQVIDDMEFYDCAETTRLQLVANVIDSLRP